MRKVQLVFPVVILLLGPAVALAQTPTDTLEAQFAVLKKTGSFAGTVDHADWQGLFERTGDRARQILGVSSAAQLKEFNRRFYTDPTEIVRKQIEQSASEGKPPALPPEKLVAAAVEQVKALNQNCAAADYSFGPEKITGDRATVEVTARKQSQTGTRTVSLTRRRGSWLVDEFPTVISTGIGGGVMQGPGEGGGRGSRWDGCAAVNTT